MKYTQELIVGLPADSILVAQWQGHPFFAAALKLPDGRWHNLWGDGWPMPDLPLFDVEWTYIVNPGEPSELRQVFSALYGTIEYLFGDDPTADAQTGQGGDDA